MDRQAVIEDWCKCRENDIRMNWDGEPWFSRKRGDNLNEMRMLAMLLSIKDGLSKTAVLASLRLPHHRKVWLNVSCAVTRLGRWLGLVEPYVMPPPMKWRRHEDLTVTVTDNE